MAAPVVMITLVVLTIVALAARWRKRRQGQRSEGACKSEPKREAIRSVSWQVAAKSEEAKQEDQAMGKARGWPATLSADEQEQAVACLRCLARAPM